MRNLLIAAVAMLPLVACGATSTSDFIQNTKGRDERHV
jgi:hypothetical protein